MTIQEFTNVTAQKVNKLGDLELKKLILSISNNFSAGMDVIERVALDRLELLISEDEFIKFCDEI